MNFYTYGIPIIFTWIGLSTLIYCDKYRSEYDRVPKWAAIIWFLAGFIPVANWPVGIVSLIGVLANKPVRDWLISPVRKVDNDSK
jgi:hypothetical protein